jgi:hypothetical protein
MLFGKATPTVRKQLTELLAFIVAGTQGPAGCANIPKVRVAEILKYEPRAIETQGNADPAGNILVRATQEGIIASGGTVQEKVTVGAGDVGSVDAVLGSSSKFVLEDGFEPPPPSKRGGIKGEIYPFAKMAVGQSFFLEATTEHPTPAKAMGSTVSSANKRFAATFPLTTGKDKKPHAQAGQPTGKDGRKFTVRERTVADGEKKNGARVYRIA